MKKKRRLKVLSSLVQPMTAEQLARKTNLNRDLCSYTLSEFVHRKLSFCLNENALHSRLYWLTQAGQKTQRNIGSEHSNVCDTQLNWKLYAWVCYNHRAAVIRAMNEAMQPSAIKRRALYLNSEIRMSANNVRDIMKLFLDRGIVRPVEKRGRSHTHYILTQTGRKIRDLLDRAHGGETFE